MKFAFAGDTNLYLDAHLVPDTEIRYKGKSQKNTTMGCGLGE